MFSLEGTIFGDVAMTFLIAMTPVLELRGAIPAGVAFGLPLPSVVIISVLGNLLPVPIIIIFIRRIFKWMRGKSKRLESLVCYFENKAFDKKDKVLKYEFWGLLLLVAVPLPGTGAWTGSLVAAMLDMRLKRAFPAIFVGVLVAALIVTCATLGISFII